MADRASSQMNVVHHKSYLEHLNTRRPSQSGRWIVSIFKSALHFMNFLYLAKDHARNSFATWASTDYSVTHSRMRRPALLCRKNADCKGRFVRLFECCNRQELKPRMEIVRACEKNSEWVNHEPTGLIRLFPHA